MEAECGNGTRLHSITDHDAGAFCTAPRGTGLAALAIGAARGLARAPSWLSKRSATSPNTEVPLEPCLIARSLRPRVYAVFDTDPATTVWAKAAAKAAHLTFGDPAHAQQWQCEETWFVGLDVLANDAAGALGDVPLAGAGPDAARSLIGVLPLHKGQVSAVTPGYPRPRDGESQTAFRYRETRDAYMWMVSCRKDQIGAGAW